MTKPEPTQGGLRFRPAVGALVLDRSGKLLLGRRNDSSVPHWQLPQGGLKGDETPEDAVIREMREELGTSRLAILGVLPRRTRYVWRGEILNDAGYVGQSHIWFVLRLDGHIEEEGASVEFSAFDWVEPEKMLEHTHPVRRATYLAVRQMFLDWLRSRNGTHAGG